MSLMRRVNIRRGTERRAAQDTKYDILDWITPAPGLHLDGATHPMYTVIGKDRYYWVKNPQGFPWDINLFDDRYIYLWVTELNWDTPRDYKKTKQRTTIPFARRYSRIGDIVVASDTTIQTVQNCNNTVAFNIGRVQCELHGPFQLSLGGDIDTVTVIEIWYRWGGQLDGTFLTLEKFSLCRGLGFVKWNTQNWNKNAHAYDPPNNETIFNLVRPGTINPTFPCTEP